MKKIFFVIFVLLICVGIGFYFYPKLKKQPLNNSNNIINIGGVSVEGDTDGVKIEPIEVKNDNENKTIIKIPMPNLDKEIKITANLDESAKQVAISKIKDITDQLKKDSDDLENWLVLGVYYKMIEDYEGSKDVWEYASKIRPKNSTSFHNLGELYAYQLKDNVKAEENYKKALENDPNAIYIYRNFFDFYRYFTKDMVKARAILEQGIAVNPNTSSDLKSLLKGM